MQNERMEQDDEAVDQYVSDDTGKVVRRYKSDTYRWASRKL